MPDSIRWVLASIILLNSAVSAAEFPTSDTAVAWRSDLDAAASEAQAENKLLFVMHLSGNLAKSAFT
jgi:hypothetical protein